MTLPINTNANINLSKFGWGDRCQFLTDALLPLEKASIFQHIKARAVGLTVVPIVYLIETLALVILGLSKILVGLTLTLLRRAWAHIIKGKSLQTNWTFSQGIYHLGNAGLCTLNIARSFILNVIDPRYPMLDVNLNNAMNRNSHPRSINTVNHTTASPLEDEVEKMQQTIKRLRTENARIDTANQKIKSEILPLQPPKLPENPIPVIKLDPSIEKSPILLNPLDPAKDPRFKKFFNIGEETNPERIELDEAQRSKILSYIRDGEDIVYEILHIDLFKDGSNESKDWLLFLYVAHELFTNKSHRKDSFPTHLWRNFNEALDIKEIDPTAKYMRKIFLHLKDHGFQYSDQQVDEKSQGKKKITNINKSSKMRHPEYKVKFDGCWKREGKYTYRLGILNYFVDPYPHTPIDNALTIAAKILHLIRNANYD